MSSLSPRQFGEMAERELGAELPAPVPGEIRHFGTADAHNDQTAFRRSPRDSHCQHRRVRLSRRAPETGTAFPRRPMGRARCGRLHSRSDSALLSPRAEEIRLVCRESRPRMRDQVQARRHDASPHVSAHPLESLPRRRLPGRIQRPPREVEIRSRMSHVVRQQPRQRRDMRVEGPSGLAGVAVVARAAKERIVRGRDFHQVVHLPVTRQLPLRTLRPNELDADGHERERRCADPAAAFPSHAAGRRAHGRRRRAAS